MPKGDQKLPRRLQQLVDVLHPMSLTPLCQGRPRTTIPIRWHLVLCLGGLIGMLAACSPNRELAVLQAVLTSDHWMIELGNGILHERYVYTFHTNGAYQACVFSQFGTRPMKGTWKITEDKQGRVHLLLENDEAYYYFLWCDSIIRYKKETDALVVSSPQYNGQKELRRTVHPKGATNALPPPKQKATGCAPSAPNI